MTGVQTCALPISPLGGVLAVLGGDDADVDLVAAGLRGGGISGSGIGRGAGLGVVLGGGRILRGHFLTSESSHQSLWNQGDKHYFEGYTAPQISRILGKNVNTIYTLLTRSKQMLRERLGGDYDYE